MAASCAPAGAMAGAPQHPLCLHLCIVSAPMWIIPSARAQAPAYGHQPWLRHGGVGRAAGVAPLRRCKERAAVAGPWGEREADADPRLLVVGQRTTKAGRSGATTEFQAPRVHAVDVR